MFTSVKLKAWKTLIIYIALTLFCGIFSFVYEQYSHGVYSSYMIYLFLFPLIGGVVPSLLSSVFPTPSGLTCNLWHPGVATLTIGSCLNGVFEIYGTKAPLVKCYWIAGAVLLVSAAAAYLYQILSALPMAYRWQGRRK